MSRCHVVSEHGDGFTHHPQVEVKANTLDVAGLLGAQQVSSSSHLEVLHGNARSATQIGSGGQGCQAVMGVLSHRKVIVIEQVGIAAFSTTAHATTQLVELREAVTLGSIHNQRVRIGDIKTGFDDRGGDQHIEASFPEVDHHPFQVGFTHLPVSNRDPGFGD